MNIPSPTFSIILDTRSKNSDNTHPIKLRCTFNRESRLFKTGLSLSSEDFQRMQSPKLRDETLKQIKLDSDAFRLKAVEISKTISPFSFQDFRESIESRDTTANTFTQNVPELDKINEQKVTKSVYDAIKDYVSQLKEEGRVSTYQSYECTLNSLSKYKPDLQFKEVTPKLLNAYETRMLSDGNSLTTVGIYLRNLRAIYNLAIESGAAQKEDYPFGRRKYVIPSGSNTKKALNSSEIERIIKYLQFHSAQWIKQGIFGFLAICVTG